MPLLKKSRTKNEKEYIKRRDVVYGRLILKLMGMPQGSRISFLGSRVVKESRKNNDAGNKLVGNDGVYRVECGRRWQT
jgi:hypothetical protein